MENYKIENGNLYIRGVVAKGIWHQVNMTDKLKDCITRHIRKSIKEASQK